MKITLTNEQKQEIVDLYWRDFYAMNIIDYFCEICPKVVNKIRKKVIKDFGYTEKDWKQACEDINYFDWEASEMIEEIELDTMNELLEMFDIDTEKTYCENELCLGY